MNRGVIAYMREGNRCAKNTFKNFINNFKYYFLLLVIFFGALCPITLPFVTILSIRMARLAERDEDIQIFKSFERVDNAKTFWTILGYHFFLGVFFLAGLILIALLAAIFAGIGLIIGGIGTVGFIIGGVLAFPLAIVLLVYLFIFPFMFQPAIYLYDCNPKLGLSGMFYNSVDAMRKTGKWTIFMMAFLYSLRHLLWLVLIAGSAVLMIVFKDKSVIRIISAVALLGFLTIYFFKFAKLTLAHQVSLVLLFNDICSSEKYISLDQSKEENTPKNVYGVSKRTLRAAKKEQLLLGLFTNGQKLVDPVGVDQSKLPNEVVDEPEEIIEEEVLAKDAPESVSEVKELVPEDYLADRRESSRYYKEPDVITDLSQPVEEESKDTEEQEVVQDLNILLAEAMADEQIEQPAVEPKETPVVEEVIAEEPVVQEEVTEEPVVEEEPALVVEKPKRGRKKATPVVEEVIAEEPVVQEEVTEEPVNTVVTEEEIGNILDDILNINESEPEEVPTPTEEVVVEKPKRGRKKVVKEE